jgi:hypothetical protein
MGIRAVRRIFFLLALLGSATGTAQQLSSELMLAERPDAGGPPTDVSLSMLLIDIDAIDDVNQRFNVDFFLTSSWQDRRLASEQGNAEAVRSKPVGEIWTPKGLIVNDRGLEARLPEVAEFDRDGNVTYRQRYTGPLAVDLDFRQFPFDTQRLGIEIVSYKYSPDELQFSSAIRVAGKAPAFSSEGWGFRILEPQASVFSVVKNDVERPQLTFMIEATRDSNFYLLTMFLPMSLIIFMSWTVFWIQPDVVAARISISTGAIFSLIAFGFSMRLSLPPVAYVTRADIFVIGCTLLVFLALGVAVTGSRWAVADTMQKAKQLNVVARWIYLLLFLLVIGVTVLN